MSHHLDGLTAKNDPRLNISDTYLFRGLLGTTFVMATNPLSGTGGFHPEAVYDFKIDLGGNAREDLTLRVTFDAAAEGGRQGCTLSALTGHEVCERAGAGLVLAHTVTGAARSGIAGVRFWAGPAADPFFIAAPVMGAVAAAVAHGTELDLGDFDPAHATNVFAGTNVQAIVIEVPDFALALTRALTIGFWGAISIPTDDGAGWRQVNRAAIPLVSPIFGFSATDDYNATRPADDDAWGDQIQSMTARAAAANGYDGDPQAYAAHVRSILSPEILRYTVGTPARFTGGRHNGRNLTENAPEEMFHLVLGRTVTTGLDASDATGTLRSQFPYLSEPV